METNENHALTKAESCYHCKHLVQQRNELTAQVERLRSAIDLSGAYKTNQVLADILCETQPAALAAFKAQWQAEAIDNALNELKYCGCDGQLWQSELEQLSIRINRSAQDDHQCQPQ